MQRWKGWSEWLEREEGEGSNEWLEREEGGGME